MFLMDTIGVRCDPAPLLGLNLAAASPLSFNVRYWPKADMPSCAAHVRFWG